MPLAAPGSSRVIAPRGLDVMIEVLEERGHTVMGPTVRDGAIVVDEVHAIDDLPGGWGDEQEAGRYRLHRRDDDALFGYAVGPSTRTSCSRSSPPTSTAEVGETGLGGEIGASVAGAVDRLAACLAAAVDDLLDR